MQLQGNHPDLQENTPHPRASERCGVFSCRSGHRVAGKPEVFSAKFGQPLVAVIKMVYDNHKQGCLDAREGTSFASDLWQRRRVR